ncbi:hypothetical protein [Bacillus paranthracis]|uniref:hypothetical protein n=1 Tax=Bacillus paranthracis TaxID=2026186 RepID=UPI001E571722|nr:hypothetical protein [Bacillus paranthracis]MCC2535807.1 hypothetical protein [Bacillus paranthracis]
MDIREKRAMLEVKLRNDEKVTNDDLADAALVVRAYGHMNDRVRYTRIKQMLRKQEVITND